MLADPGLPRSVTRNALGSAVGRRSGERVQNMSARLNGRGGPSIDCGQGRPRHYPIILPALPRAPAQFESNRF